MNTTNGRFNVERELYQVFWCAVDRMVRRSKYHLAGRATGKTYTLMFCFSRDEAVEIQTYLHEERENAGESLNQGWRERCLLRLLRKTT